MLKRLWKLKRTLSIDVLGNVGQSVKVGEESVLDTSHQYLVKRYFYSRRKASSAFTLQRWKRGKMAFERGRTCSLPVSWSQWRFFFLLKKFEDREMIFVWYFISGFYMFWFNLRNNNDLEREIIDRSQPDQLVRLRLIRSINFNDWAREREWKKKYVHTESEYLSVYSTDKYQIFELGLVSHKDRRIEHQVRAILTNIVLLP